MRPLHLVERFARALWPGAPSPADETWAGTVLSPSELLLYRRLDNHDRRHAIAVARRVEATLGPDPDVLAAALLHDVGKYDAGLGVLGRACATVPVLVLGRRRVSAWRARSGWRGRAGTYAAHGERGAEEIRAAGGREAAAAWSAAHHVPESWPSLTIPAPAVAALDAADNA